MMLSTLTPPQRALLWLPLLVVPLLTLAFYALGGGGPQAPLESKLNDRLPEAVFKEAGILDKLKTYEKAALDSSRLDQVRFPADSLDQQAWQRSQRQRTQVMHQLDALEHRYAEVPVRLPPVLATEQDSPAPPRLPRPDPGPDPELKALHALLDKVILVQRGAADSLPVATVPVVTSRPDSLANAFYGLSLQAGPPAALRAEIAHTQTIQPGGTVCLRLTEPGRLGTLELPAQQPLCGQAQLRGERLLISIVSLRRGQTLRPVQLTVYDVDGIEGLLVPGSLTRESLQESAQRSAQRLMLPVGGLETQAAQLGLQTAQTLLQKHGRARKVTLPAGYQVLLQPFNPSRL